MNYFICMQVSKVHPCARETKYMAEGRFKCTAHCRRPGIIPSGRIQFRWFKLLRYPSDSWLILLAWNQSSLFCTSLCPHLTVRVLQICLIQYKIHSVWVPSPDTCDASSSITGMQDKFTLPIPSAWEPVSAILHKITTQCACLLLQQHYTPYINALVLGHPHMLLSPHQSACQLCDTTTHSTHP